MTTTLTPTDRDPPAAAEPVPPPARRGVRSTVADAAAAAALGWAILSLARTDGGVDLIILARAAWPLLAVAPVAALELRRLRRPGPYLVAWYGLAALASIAFAGIRSSAVTPAIVYAALPIAALVTMRLWRRAWGPAVVGGVLAVAFAASWWEAFLAWVGSLLDPGPVENWLALSWHNQSAMLMGSFALLAAALAVTARRQGPAMLAVAVAAAGFGAAWLAGSRGGLVAIGLGIAAVAVATRFRHPLRWGAVAGATIVAVVLLTSIPSPEPVALALDSKSLSAADSASARLDHMAAAVAMFLDRPLVGHGLGSYASGSGPFAATDSNPSYHAHNEFIEPFAEGGVAFGGAMLAVLLAVGLAAARALRRGVVAGRPPRPGIAAGSLGVLAALVAHAAIDFDWLFPILAVLAAVAAGIVLAADRPADAPASSWPAALGLVPVAALLALGLVGATVELRGSGAPWHASAAATEVEQLLADGDVAGALDRAGDARRWNPGHRLLRTLEAAAAHEAGAADAADVVATLDAAAPALGTFNTAAESLLRTGDVDEAASVLATVTGLYRERAAWDLSGSIDRSWHLTITAAGARGGCAAARQTAAALATDRLTARIHTPAYPETVAVYCD